MPTIDPKRPVSAPAPLQETALAIALVAELSSLPTEQHYDWAQRRLDGVLRGIQSFQNADTMRGLLDFRQVLQRFSPDTVVTMQQKRKIWSAVEYMLDRGLVLPTIDTVPDWRWWSQGTGDPPTYLAMQNLLGAFELSNKMPWKSLSLHTVYPLHPLLSGRLSRAILYVFNILANQGWVPGELPTLDQMRDLTDASDAPPLLSKATPEAPYHLIVNGHHRVAAIIILVAHGYLPAAAVDLIQYMITNVPTSKIVRKAFGRAIPHIISWPDAFAFDPHLQAAARKLAPPDPALEIHTDFAPLLMLRGALDVHRTPDDVLLGYARGDADPQTRADIEAQLILAGQEELLRPLPQRRGWLEWARRR